MTLRSLHTSSGLRFPYQIPWVDTPATRYTGTLSQPIAFDTETELISTHQPYSIPRLALATAASRDSGCILRPRDLAHWILAHAKSHLVFHNAVFDFWVVDSFLEHQSATSVAAQEARPVWRAMLTEGRMHDTMLLDQLLQLATEDTQELPRRNLAVVAQSVGLQLDLDKSDPFRLRYGELIDADWNRVEEGFWEYAIRDAWATQLVWGRLYRQATRLYEQARSLHPGWTYRQAIATWGPLTESLQVRGACALWDAGRNGLRVDLPSAQRFIQQLRNELAFDTMRVQNWDSDVFLYQDECHRGGTPRRGVFNQPLFPGFEREIAVTPKGRTPRFKRDALTRALVAAHQQVFPQKKVPQAGGKTGGVSLSAADWKAVATQHSGVRAWISMSRHIKSLGYAEPLLHTPEIHPVYNPLLLTGRTSAIKPNLQQCYSGDTELLTREGWIRFDTLLQLDVADRPGVAQWQPDGSIDFVEAQEWIYNREPTPLVRLHNEHIDLAVTADHRCLVRERHTGDWLVFSAEKYPENHHQMHGGCYVGGPGLPLSDDALRLAVATQADGSWNRQHIDFTFAKMRKVDRLKSILDSLQIPYTLKPKAYRDQWRFYVQNSEVVQSIRRLLGPEKWFGAWVLSLSRKQLDVFVEEVFHWDATFRTERTYTSIHARNADWVQIALILSDRRSCIRRHSGCFDVSHTRRGYSYTTNIQRELLPSQPSYCVRVPSGFVLVRRNGCTMVSGNCPKTEGFREIFRPRAGHQLITADYSAIELRTLAAICEQRYRKSVLAHVLREGRDPHTFTASLISGVDYEEMLAWLNLSEDSPSRQDPRYKQYKLFRQSAKALNFGVPGGLGPKRLAIYATESYDTPMSVEEAREFRNRLIQDVYPELTDYLRETTFSNLAWNLKLPLRTVVEVFRSQPQLKFWVRHLASFLDGTSPYTQEQDRLWRTMADLVRQAPRTTPRWIGIALRERRGSEALRRALLSGIALTPTGRIRHGCSYTEQRNTPFQGLAADGAKLALWQIVQAGYRVVGFLHDEILVEVPEEQAQTALVEVTRVMNEAMNSVLRTVPSVVSAGVGAMWSK
jgi:hypothetical protein